MARGRYLWCVVLALQCRICISILARSPCPMEMNMGIRFEQVLNMKLQTEIIWRASVSQLKHRQSIAHHVSIVALEHVIHAFNSSRLDNHNTLLSGLPALEHSKSQRIQNIAVRIIAKPNYIRLFENLALATCAIQDWLLNSTVVSHHAMYLWSYTV